METDRLRYFCLIAETGSLTKASELLNISHSGLSKAMSVLQNEIGQILFRPQGRGLELTDAGKAVYGKSKDVLALVDKLKRNVESLPTTRLRLGLTEIFSIGLGAELATELSPNLDLHDLDSGELETKVLNGQIDFAISSVPYPHPQLDHLKIAHAAMGVYVKNSELLNLPLEDISFVGPNTEVQNNPLSIRARDGWPEAQPRKLAYGASSLSTAMGLVDSGKAAVFIPKFLAESLNLVRNSHFQLLEYVTDKRLLKTSERDIYLVKKKNMEETKEMKVVARVIRKRLAKKR